jgi:epoxyqueuosine reductase
MRTFIKELASSVGFDACGIARAQLLTEDAQYLRQWLENGYQGDMSYLERNFDKRCDPTKLVDGCKTVVVMLLNYSPSTFQNSSAPRVAKYAYSSVDYHKVLKQKIKLVEDKLIEIYGQDVVSSDLQHSFVDSAPILERRWAARAGLGWIGKNKMLIAPGLGSYTFIGILLLNRECDSYDEPIKSRCGNCTRCIDSCPTKALTSEALIASKCISYQTIEKKTVIDEGIYLSNQIYGCDICQDVCPWNKKWAMPHNHEELLPGAYIQWTEQQWSNMTQMVFDKVFHESAVLRAGYDKLKENICINLTQKE